MYRTWDRLDSEISCPVHFTPDEIDRHYKDAEGWNKLQDFRDATSHILQRDGWTHHDTYDRALALHDRMINSQDDDPEKIMARLEEIFDFTKPFAVV